MITTCAPTAIMLAKWGFVPEAWKSSHIRLQNNARLEIASKKPMFGDSFSGRRCMVLATASTNGSRYATEILGLMKFYPQRVEGAGVELLPIRPSAKCNWRPTFYSPTYSCAEPRP
jgi:hypothetical protein